MHVHQVYLIGGDLPGPTSPRINRVDVVNPYPNGYSLFRSPWQLQDARSQFSAINPKDGNLTAVGGDPGGDTEDIMTCPPQYTGPDCNMPNASTCNYGYFRLNGECTVWYVSVCGCEWV